MDTVACLQRLHGCLPTAAVTIQQDTTAKVSHHDASVWFRTASTFWSPVTLRVLPSKDNGGPPQSSNNPDEVAVSHWTVVADGGLTAHYTVFQNLDHEQRIVWTTPCG